MNDGYAFSYAQVVPGYNRVILDSGIWRQIVAESTNQCRKLHALITTFISWHSIHRQEGACFCRRRSQQLCERGKFNKVW